jgi:hypothetical protein
VETQFVAVEAEELSFDIELAGAVTPGANAGRVGFWMSVGYYESRWLLTRTRIRPRGSSALTGAGDVARLGLGIDRTATGDFRRGGSRVAHSPCSLTTAHVVKLLLLLGALFSTAALFPLFGLNLLGELTVKSFLLRPFMSGALALSPLRVPACGIARGVLLALPVGSCGGNCGLRLDFGLAPALIVGIGPRRRWCRTVRGSTASLELDILGRDHTLLSPSVAHQPPLVVRAVNDREPLVFLDVKLVFSLGVKVIENKTCLGASVGLWRCRRHGRNRAVRLGEANSLGFGNAADRSRRGKGRRGKGRRGNVVFLARRLGTSVGGNIQDLAGDLLAGREFVDDRLGGLGAASVEPEGRGQGVESESNNLGTLLLDVGKVRNRVLLDGGLDVSHR